MVDGGCGEVDKFDVSAIFELLMNTLGALIAKAIDV